MAARGRSALGRREPTCDQDRGSRRGSAVRCAPATRDRRLGGADHGSGPLTPRQSRRRPAFRPSGVGVRRGPRGADARRGPVGAARELLADPARAACASARGSSATGGLARRPGLFDARRATLLLRRARTSGATTRWTRSSAARLLDGAAAAAPTSVLVRAAGGCSFELVAEGRRSPGAPDRSSRRRARRPRWPVALARRPRPDAVRLRPRRGASTSTRRAPRAASVAQRPTSRRGRRAARSRSPYRGPHGPRTPAPPPTSPSRARSPACCCSTRAAWTRA